MRRAADLPGRRPRRRSRLRTSGRYALITAVLLIILVVVIGRALARFYIDELWFDALGRSEVFWTTLRAKLTLFGMFFGVFALLAGVNLVVADKLAPARFPANVHPYVERFHDFAGRRLRLYRYLGAGVVALVLALPTTTQWQSWLLYRNRQSFGSGDAQFGVDVGFYVFELPFLSFVLDWLFLAVVVVLFLTIVSHILNGGVVFASPMPSVSQAMKGHVAVLLAVLAALKAADYWVRRYETTNARRGFVQGPTYAVEHAQLPALLLLIVVALVTAGLYLSTLRTQSFRIPLIASAIWLALAILGGYVYPAAIQSLVVEPNQQSREAEAIEHNVDATQQAMGLTPNEVTQIRTEFNSLTADDVVGDAAALENIRLLNPEYSRSQFQYYEGAQAGLIFDDVDVDRAVLDEEIGVEQILIAAKELDSGGAPNRSWQGQHLIYTHGCGLVQAPASRVQSNGRPQFSQVELTHDELYFSPTLTGWAVAGTDEDEQGCAGTDEYEGSAGVEMSSWLRRASFALSFMDYNLLGSGSINDGSQMLWVRNVRDRVEKLAPFLTFDGDPYPVEVDGRALWVVDAYTSTSRYPSAQAVGDDVGLSSTSGIPTDANYVRNSVKAVVDAYDGTVQFYVVDNGDDDPIIRAWMSAFPDLFSPIEDMPDGLEDHLRYPEDLFRVQTSLYSKYQLSPEAFFGREGAWSVAQAPPSALPSSTTATATDTPSVDDTQEFATESSNVRFNPYYTLFDTAETVSNPGDEEFVIVRPFVPFSSDDGRTELQAYMTASSDPDHYGDLTVYRVDNETLPDGPRGVVAAIETDDDIARLVSELNEAGSNANVVFGDLQLVPIGEDGLLWARPFYVTTRPGSGQQLTTYRFMVVVANGDAAFSSTIGGALAVLYPDLDLDVGERIASGDPVTEPELPIPDGGEEPSEPSPPDSVPDGAPSDTAPSSTLPDGATADEVLLRIEQLLADAEAAREDGDLGRYQDLVTEASDLLETFLVNAATATPGSEPPAGTASDG